MQTYRPAVTVLVALLGFASFPRTGLTQPNPTSQLIDVKYRPSPVDVSDPRFEHTDTSRSSFVTDAWYDDSHDYMVIGLQGTNYHYCRIPQEVWDAFQQADSFGRFYNRDIKGRYDCRLGGVPEY